MAILLINIKILVYSFELLVESIKFVALINKLDDYERVFNVFPIWR